MYLYVLFAFVWSLRTLYVYDHDIHEVLQSLRHVAWVRGTEILVVLAPRDKGKGG